MTTTNIKQSNSIAASTENCNSTGDAGFTDGLAKRPIGEFIESPHTQQQQQQQRTFNSFMPKMKPETSSAIVAAAVAVYDFFLQTSSGIGVVATAYTPHGNRLFIQIYSHNLHNVIKFALGKYSEAAQWTCGGGPHSESPH